MSLYSVMTFWHADPGKRPFAIAYLRDANPQWNGCITYEVNAENGRKAKLIAEKMRRDHEQKKQPEVNDG